MTEAFLHYLWQFQYFDKAGLTTSAGEPLTILRPGSRNPHAGPDFSNAQVRIGDLVWTGTVELHIQASTWNAHKHGTDPAYENVILHVVWENDKPVIRADGSPMPTLVLQSRADMQLWHRYRKFVHQPVPIPCFSLLSSVPPVIINDMFTRAVHQRLETRAVAVLQTLERNAGNWEETCYQWLSLSFGFHVNAEPFQQLSQVLPYGLVRKQGKQLPQVEALVLGMAGFLDRVSTDVYARELAAVFTLLQNKYHLHQKKMHASQWRFLRLRPANFPTVRLSQWAALLHRHSSLFSKITETSVLTDMHNLFQVEQSAYWRTHYRFGKPATRVPSLGKASIDTLLINAVIPVLVAYGKQQGEQVYVDRALEWLQGLPPEKNAITRQWKTADVHLPSALECQGSIELTHQYCRKRRCLECGIGFSILKPASP
jgi:hypothetical protein